MTGKSPAGTVPVWDTISELCPRGCPECQGLPACCCPGSDGVSAGAAIRALCQGLSPEQLSCWAGGDMLPISLMSFAPCTRTVFQHSLYDKQAAVRGQQTPRLGALIIACACFLFLLLHQGSHSSGVHPHLLCSGDEPSLIPSYPFPKPRHIPHLVPVPALP